MAFAIKAEVRNPRAKVFVFTAQKTMYGGKHIAKGDAVLSSPARIRVGKASSLVASRALPTEIVEPQDRLF